MNEISVARLESVVVLMARWEAFASLVAFRFARGSAFELASAGSTARNSEAADAVGGDLVVCRLASAALSTEVRMHVHHFGPAAICAWSRMRTEPQQVIAGSVLDAEPVLLARLTLPKSALAALPRILEQDILRRTPFQLSDIWHAAVPTAPAHELAGADVMAMRTGSSGGPGRSGLEAYGPEPNQGSWLGISLMRARKSTSHASDLIGQGRFGPVPPDDPVPHGHDVGASKLMRRCGWDGCMPDVG